MQPHARAAPAAAPDRERHDRRTETVEVAGVRVTHPDRVLYPARGFTKHDVARYYEAIAPWMVPHVADRPLTIVRCPAGAGAPCAYMRHAHAWGPPALRRVLIREKTKTGEYLVADSAAALVSLAQMDVLEIHTWNAHVSRLEQPDRLVFDLDPGPGVAWERVIDAARLVRELLRRLDLAGFPLLTGGVGMHVAVPLAPRAGWDEALAFARALSGAMARLDPRSFTASMVKSARAGRIYVDYLRNHRAATAVSPFSTRATPAASVAVPIAWDELAPELRSDAFSLPEVLGRVRSLRRDPWEGWEGARQRLRRSMTRTLDDARLSRRAG